ncbi:MAG: gamma-glutamyltranspeptidase [Acidimicrobiales bacterium]|nr:gamma-glutamyltranspeptidase [Acidimicrobiales bacterium]RZV43070.1 MAG: gamma-glutamyltranspeptidase [Acidimicrobiales bacterium]
MSTPREVSNLKHHIVASADELATAAGNEIFEAGGNAIDAAIATNAAIAVVGPNLCGMGGDLFALVYVDDAVVALNASGRAGSGADAEQLRAEGFAEMPYRHDIRTVTVPGCVDGWMELHERFGSLPLDVILEPARRLAEDGFRTSPLLANSIASLDDQSRETLHELVEQASGAGEIVRRPGVARALQAVSTGGREAFYQGEFGEGLRQLGDGLFTKSDLAESNANWEEPLSTTAFGVDLHTSEPNSQGYLALAGARLAAQLELPADPDDELWAHLLAEAARAAGRDRPQQLHENAAGDALLDLINGRIDEIDPEVASTATAPARDGDTTYLCTAGRRDDGSMMAVSLIQSNAAGIGSHLVEPNTGINLHNRGLGFNLTPGHPAEFGPRRRPPHTLLPAMATNDGELVAVFGTMGGDAQPQIVLQLIVRLFHHRQGPADAVNAGRWSLRGESTGFDSWVAPNDLTLAIEGQAPAAWADTLRARGHRTEVLDEMDSRFGHAHAIVVEPDGSLSGAADPRCVVGTCEGR